MAQTFTKIYIQYVFAVQGRENHLHKDWRDEVFKYMTGIVRNKQQKPIIINGTSDHVHMLVGLKPTMLISDLVRDIKNNSTNFINERGWLTGKFRWQEGYGAFSYSHSQLEQLYQYILNQDKHHQKMSFREEYLGLLKRFEIDFADHHLFVWDDEPSS